MPARSESEEQKKWTMNSLHGSLAPKGQEGTTTTQPAGRPRLTRPRRQHLRALAPRGLGRSRRPSRLTVMRTALAFALVAFALALLLLPLLAPARHERTSCRSRA